MKKEGISMHYLDHAATTPIHPKVSRKIMQTFEDFGNPSSIYQFGRRSKKVLNETRQLVKEVLHAQRQDDIVFTSSGSEANNLVIQSVMKEYANEKVHFITSCIEHASVFKTMQWAETQGVEVTYLPVNSYGVVDVQVLKEAIKENTRLVSVMFINNEIGTYQPIQEIGELLRDTGILFHTDAVQAFGHEFIDVQELGVDYLTFSGHKINAPKGIGGLYRRNETPLHPMVYGGGQEKGYRSGTENIPYVAGLKQAIEIKLEQPTKNYQEFIKELETQLDLSRIEYEWNGDRNYCTSRIGNLWIKHISASQLLISCDLNQVYVSAGSACSAGSLEPSRVLLSLFDEQSPRIHQSIRISFGYETSKKDIEAFVQSILQLKNRL